jgi:hypothetical protein
MFSTLDGKATMDWARAIERNSEALNRIVEVLFAMLGLVADAVPVARIPHPLHRAVLRVLWPAESAVRRLVVMAARGLVVKPVPARPMPKGKIIGKGGSSSRLTFQLFDTRKSFAEFRQRRVKYAKNPPRIHFFPYDTFRPAPPAPPPPDGLVNAKRLTRRLQALKLALDDLPRQAKRLARLRFKRENIPTLKYKSPLRPGRPPGHRRKPVHEIDEVLIECHALARDAMKPDTS